MTVIKGGEWLLRLLTHVFVSRRIADSVSTILFFLSNFVSSIVWFADLHCDWGEPILQLIRANFRWLVFLIYN